MISQIKAMNFLITMYYTISYSIIFIQHMTGDAEIGQGGKRVNLYNAEIFCILTMETKGVFFNLKSS